jgi:hypothetical protein
MANNFQVKTKNKSTRCEICHQTDQFDLATETCLRCNALVVANLLPQPTTNNQFNDWMVTLGRPSTPSLTIRDFLSILRESIQLYFQNFFLFLGIFSIAIFPSAFLSEHFIYSFLGVTDGLSNLLIYWGIPFVLIAVSGAILSTAIYNRYQNQPTSIITSYRELFKRGGKFISTVIFGQIYQIIGIVFCWLGLLYTYPSGAFVSESAVVDQHYKSEAFKTSHRFGMQTPVYLLFLGLIAFVIPKLASFYIADILGSKMITYGIYKTDLSDFFGACIKIGLYPLFSVIKMLMYLKLHDPNTATQSTSGTSGTTFQLR